MPTLKNSNASTNKLRVWKRGKALKDLDEIKLIQRRFELITVARYRDKSRMKKAMEVQDKLREKSKGFKWDSTKELRKWKDLRYAASS